MHRFLMGPGIRTGGRIRKHSPRTHCRPGLDVIAYKSTQIERTYESTPISGWLKIVGPLELLPDAQEIHQVCCSESMRN